MCRFSHVRLRLFAEHLPAWTLSANIILIDPMGQRPAITARVHRGRARNWRECGAAVAVESRHYRRRSRNNTIIVDRGTTVYLSLRTKLVTEIIYYYYSDRYQERFWSVTTIIVIVISVSDQTRVITGARDGTGCALRWWHHRTRIFDRRQNVSRAPPQRIAPVLVHFYYYCRFSCCAILSAATSLIWISPKRVR